MRILPFLEPKPPATQSSSASRPTLAWWVAKCHVSVDRFCSETYSSFAPCSTNSSTAAFEYATTSGAAETYSSIRLKRLPSSATTSRRQNSEESTTVLATRTYSGRASSTPRATRTSSPCLQSAALWAVNLSSAPTSVPSRSASSVSASKATPSGTPENSTPSSPTVATAAA